MSNRQYNPHAWFFACVRDMDDFNPQFENEIRAGIVTKYSRGITSSLADLYRDYLGVYQIMKRDLMAQQQDTKDKARKRLIAALFQFLESHPAQGDLKKKTITMQYVKGVAANAAKVTNFNEITLRKLKSLYRVFGEKNAKNMSQAEKELVWKAFKMKN